MRYMTAFSVSNSADRNHFPIKTKTGRPWLSLPATYMQLFVLDTKLDMSMCWALCTSLSKRIRRMSSSVRGIPETLPLDGDIDRNCRRIVGSHGTCHEGSWNLGAIVTEAPPLPSSASAHTATQTAALHTAGHTTARTTAISDLGHTA